MQTPITLYGVRYILPKGRVWGTAAEGSQSSTRKVVDHVSTVCEIGALLPTLVPIPIACSRVVRLMQDQASDICQTAKTIGEPSTLSANRA